MALAPLARGFSGKKKKKKAAKETAPILLGEKHENKTDICCWSPEEGGEGGRQAEWVKGVKSTNFQF